MDPLGKTPVGTSGQVNEVGLVNPELSRPIFCPIFCPMFCREDRKMSWVLQK